ncbi:MAG: hypothetical protein ABIJ92_01225 [Candidatus Aenigmatarchaeota archaeon]
MLKNCNLLLMLVLIVAVMTGCSDDNYPTCTEPSIDPMTEEGVDALLDVEETLTPEELDDILIQNGIDLAQMDPIEIEVIPTPMDSIIEIEFTYDEHGAIRPVKCRNGMAYVGNLDDMTPDELAKFLQLREDYGHRRIPFVNNYQPGGLEECLARALVVCEGRGKFSEFAKFFVHSQPGKPWTCDMVITVASQITGMTEWLVERKMDSPRTELRLLRDRLLARIWGANDSGWQAGYVFFSMSGRPAWRCFKWTAPIAPMEVLEGWLTSCFLCEYPN